MGWWLAEARTVQAEGTMTRFDPVYWTVNFPRPMMASVVATAADALRVDAVFYRRDDLAGLIWEAEDRHDHVLLAYATSRDFRGCRLDFRWQSSGVVALDAVNGPVLTIEGRDAEGEERAWYVRLWNYAGGTPEDALVSIDFADVDGGFLLPGEADPVFAGDVDRMFVSLVPEGFSGSDEALAAPVEAWVEISDLVCEGPGAVLAIGDAVVPEHGLGIANGYDDCYHLTPARALRNALRLGYRGSILHYVGMSHYFRLEEAGGGYYASLAGGVLNVACAAWHADFAARAKALGYEVIWSLSYELLDQHCWGDWKQRAFDGSPGLTGWEPPSALLSPAHAGAMGYLEAVALAFAGIAIAAGLGVRFQIGEPWWWVTADGRLCIHDDAARAALGDPDEQDMLGAPDTAVLDAAGEVLAASTLALRDAVKGADAGGAGAAARLSADDPRPGDARARAREPAIGLGAPGVRNASARGLRLGDVGQRRRERARCGRGRGAAGLSGGGAALSFGLRACARGGRAVAAYRRGRRGGAGARRGGDLRLGAAAGAARRLRAFRPGG